MEVKSKNKMIKLGSKQRALEIMHWNHLKILSHKSFIHLPCNINLCFSTTCEPLSQYMGPLGGVSLESSEDKLMSFLSGEKVEGFQWEH